MASSNSNSWNLKKQISKYNIEDKIFTWSIFIMSSKPVHFQTLCQDFVTINRDKIEEKNTKILNIKWLLLAAPDISRPMNVAIKAKIISANRPIENGG